MRLAVAGILSAGCLALVPSRLRSGVMAGHCGIPILINLKVDGLWFPNLKTAVHHLGTQVPGFSIIPTV